MKYLVIVILIFISGCKTIEHDYAAPIEVNNIRLGCLEASNLTRFGEEGIRRLARALLSKHHQTRQYAGFALIELGYRAIPVFIPALKNTERAFYRNAQLAITMIVTREDAAKEEALEVLEKIKLAEPSLKRKIDEIGWMIERQSEKDNK